MKIPSKSRNVHCRFLAAIGLALVAATTARADYQSTVLADNPVAFYALNPASDPAGVSPDLTANGNDGSAFNITATNGPSAFIPNAAAFDGADAAVDLGGGANPGLLNFSGPITLEAWVQSAPPSGYSGSQNVGNIIAKGYDSSVNYAEIVLRVNGWYGDVYYGGSGNAGVSGGNFITNWAHVVMSSDGTYNSLYVNGVLVQKTSDTSGAINFGDAFRIGTGSADGTGRWFKGNISEVAIYNHGLTAGQVLAHYNMGMYGSTTAPAGNSLRWSPSANSGVWDATVSANWTNSSTTLQTPFTNNDVVLFDDAAGAPTTVAINGLVLPGSVTVTANANNFTINGSGELSTSGSFTKNGSSTLNLNVPAYISGPVKINGGTVVAGYYAFRDAASILITNATMDIAGGDLNQHTPITVSGSGVGGNGAIINSSYETYNNNIVVTLAGDTTFGGSSRWDLAGGSVVTGPHNLTIKRSSSGGYGEWSGATINNDVGNIELAVGKLGLKNMGSSFGNPAASFTVDSGAELDFWTGEGGYSKNFHVMGGLFQILTGFSSFSGNITFESGSQFNSFYGSGSQTMNGNITLNGDTHFVFGDANFVFPNPITGTGGFVWDAYNHQIVLQAANTYSGATVIGGGLTLALTGSGSISHSSVIFFGGSSPANVSLDASGRSDGTLTLASGQTLGGIGTVGGKLVVSAGATIAPSGTNVILSMTEGNSSSGTLSANNNITLNGTTLIKLNGSGVNDQVKSSTSIAYSGTLNLANISSPLAAGNSFQIFNAPSISGTFTTVTPATPGAGLAWDLSQLNTSGFVNVVSTSGPLIASATVSGGNLIFSGSGGPVSGTYAVLSATNLLTPIASWTSLVTNSFDGSGNFSVTTPVTVGKPQAFYRLKVSP